MQDSYSILKPMKFTVNTSIDYKNPLWTSLINQWIKKLEDDANYFYKTGHYRLEDLCDDMRYFLLDLISAHCAICKSRETSHAIDQLINGICPTCKRLEEYRKYRQNFYKE